MSTFIDKRQALQSFKFSSTTLKKYRLEGIWIEGLHWVRINRRCVRYNLELIQDWVHNCQDPVAHQRANTACSEANEQYQASLMSNQKRSGRKNSHL